MSLNVIFFIVYRLQIFSEIFILKFPSHPFHKECNLQYKQGCAVLPSEITLMAISRYRKNSWSDSGGLQYYKTTKLWTKQSHRYKTIKKNIARSQKGAPRTSHPLLRFQVVLTKILLVRDWVFSGLEFFSFVRIWVFSFIRRKKI